MFSCRRVFLKLQPHGRRSVLKLVGELFVEITRSAEFDLFAERRLLHPAEITFCPGYLPAIQALVRVGGTRFKCRLRTVSEFPAIHDHDPPF